MYHTNDSLESASLPICFSVSITWCGRSRIRFGQQTNRSDSFYGCCDYVHDFPGVVRMLTIIRFSSNLVDGTLWGLLYATYIDTATSNEKA